MERAVEGKNINPPTPCQIGKRPPAPKPKRESAGHQGVAGGGYNLSRIPSVTFFRGVRPDSEMTRQNHQIVTPHGVSWRIVLGAVRGRATPGTPRACCRPLVRFWWVSGGWLAPMDPSRGSRSSRSRRSSGDARMMDASLHHTMACGDVRGESRTVVLRRSGRVIESRECDGFPIPVGRRALASTELSGSGHYEWLSVRK